MECLRGDLNQALTCLLSRAPCAVADFVESEGATIDEFFKECREIHDGQYTALFEEHTYAWFVDHLLACMDYKHFYGLMVNEARRLHHRK